MLQNHGDYAKDFTRRNTIRKRTIRRKQKDGGTKENKDNKINGKITLIRRKNRRS